MESVMKAPKLARLGAAPMRAALRPQEDTLAEARLREAWAYVVGPFLARQTRLLRVQRGRVVLGCWQLHQIPSLRQAAEHVWPQVRERVQRVLGLRLGGMEVLPCDPPPAPEETKTAPNEDPLRAVLERLRELRRP
jgi:hypothetical protein